MRLRHLAALVAGSAVVAMSACAAKPRTRPLATTPIAEGAGTMEAARQALVGRWILTSLHASTEDGRRQAIDASGVLNADASGGLAVEYRISDAGRQALTSLGIDAPSPVISTSGRVVIDAQQQRITYVGDDFERGAQGFDRALAERRANPFALERTRHYQFEAAGALILSTRYASGKDALVGRWKKAE